MYRFRASTLMQDRRQQLTCSNVRSTLQACHAVPRHQLGPLIALLLERSAPGAGAMQSMKHSDVLTLLTSNRRFQQWKRYLAGALSRKSQVRESRSICGPFVPDYLQMCINMIKKKSLIWYAHEHNVRMSNLQHSPNLTHHGVHSWKWVSEVTRHDAPSAARATQCRFLESFAYQASLSTVGKLATC